MKRDTGGQTNSFRSSEIQMASFNGDFDDRWKYQIVRVGAIGAFGGIVTSDCLTGIKTHWWDRRTTPCTGDGCEPCQHGRGWQKKGYLWVWNTRKMKHYIFELPERAAREVQRWHTASGQLRGATIKMSRPKGNKRSAIAIDLIPPTAEIALPNNPPPILQVLETIWTSKRPQAREELTLPRPGHPSIVVATNGERP